MRQAGILAAACLYAIDHNLRRIERTHSWARDLARAAASSPIFRIDPEKVETNIVVIETPGISAARAVSVLGSLGIGCLTLSPTSLRIVTHLSLTERDVRFAAASLAAFGG